MTSFRFRGALALLGVLLAVAAGTARADVPLAAGGKPSVGVAWTPAENEKLKQAAETLAGYLGRMSGGTFTVAPGTPEKGIVLCLRGSGALPAEDDAKLAAMGAEAHVIRAGGGRVLLGGNSEKAVLNACYDLLHRLGCRWLIPSARWTVIPRRPDLAVPEMVVFAQPDLVHRSIWYAYGMGVDGSREVLARDYGTWFDANRLGGVAPFKSGHTYPAVVAKHEEEFKAHPEFFAMDEKGERLPFKTHTSLCYSNPRVAEIFIAAKLAELRADKLENRFAFTVSMDPNDGSIACNCGACRALGNGSDQCLHLANKVAVALRREFPEAVVSFYVYASHRLPPEKVKAEPNINVQVAMGFNNTPYTLEELVQLWRQKVSTVGIRDYLGVMAWDWGLPGRGKGSRFRYVKETFPKFKAWGATTYNSEINANWGTFGPAVYVATRLLWDAGADADAAQDDFFRHAYGAAAPEMKALHALWADSTELTRQNLHFWFRQMDKAFGAAQNEPPEVKARLLDMAACLHYARLFADWETAVQSHERDRAYAALKPMLEFTWRIRERGMVHAYALQRRLVNSGHDALQPLEPGWKFSDPKAVWKHPDPLTDDELRAIYKADLAATPPDTRLRRFSADLKPFPGQTPGERIGGNLRHDSTWHILAEDPAHLRFALPVKGVRYNYELKVYDMADEIVWETEYTVPRSLPRGEQQDFSLDVRLPKPGQYRLTIKAGEDYCPTFPKGMKVVLETSLTSHPTLRYTGGYFYVPADTDRILLKTSGRFSVQAPGWRARKDLTTKDEDPALGCIVIPVGNDAGKLWTVTAMTAGSHYFLNIPPYLAVEPGALLIPSDAARPGAR